MTDTLQPRDLDTAVGVTKPGNAFSAEPVPDLLNEPSTRKSFADMTDEFDEQAPARAATPPAKPAMVAKPDLEADTSGPDISEEEREYFRQVFGAEPEEIRELVTERKESRAAAQFLADHAGDYTPSPRNAELIQKFLTQNDLPVSRENLELAHVSLKSDFETSGKPASRRPASSGISDTVHAAPQHVTAERIIEESYAMPLSQLRLKIQREAYERNRGAK